MNSDLILLLQLTGARAPLDSLLNRGYDYSGITLLIDQAVKEELLEITPEGIVLSTLGRKILLDRNFNDDSGTPGWISPDPSAAIEKLDESQIYLPPINKSFFGA